MIDLARAVGTRVALLKWLAITAALCVLDAPGFGPAAFAAAALPKSLDALKAMAEQGDAPSQFQLGLFYHHQREGVPPDDAEAVKWYRQSAAQGYAPAQYNLGIAYAEGEGIPRDYEEAYMWFSLAAAQGNADARKSLDRIETLLTPDQRAEARKMVTGWKPHALLYWITSKNSAIICPNLAISELISKVLMKYYGSRESVVLSDPKYLTEVTNFISGTSCTLMPAGTKMKVEWDDDVYMVWPVVTARLRDGTEIHGVTTEVEPPERPYLPPKLRGVSP